MHRTTFEALGTVFTVQVWDPLSAHEYAALIELAKTCARDFDNTYSRFKADSLITQMSRAVGVYAVPHDLVCMLQLYEKLNHATGGAINPAIGFALADTGYDAAYSLQEAPIIRATPRLADAVLIIDATHVDMRAQVLLDLGALGKGYLVDRITELFIDRGLQHFLVDGSGDIRYVGKDDTPILCGLEHPTDTSKVIGTLSITGGSLCASATNRRTWGSRNHYIDPESKQSPQEVIATWVYADTAALADGLSSALFFVEPEALSMFNFEWCIVNHALQRKNSAGFAAEFF
jgi:thiamine biosynthesis lipoprotein